MPTMKIKLWILSIGILAVSCSSPKALEYKDYRNFSIQKLGFGSSQVTLELEYYNPNNFGLQLKNTELDIYIDNQFLGHSISDTLIGIPRRGPFMLPIKFDVDMQSIYKNAWNTLMGKEVMVKVIGKLKLGKGNVFMSMPVNYEGKQKLSLF